MSATAAGRGGRSLLPLLLVPLPVLVYLLTFSHVSSLDALYYFRDFEHGALRDLLHPHHLVFELVTRGWCDLWRTLGWHGLAEVPAKGLSLVVAAGALVIFARTLRFLFGGGFMAGALFLVMAFSYVPWHFASEAEPVIFFLLLSCWTLDLLLRRLLLPAGSGPATWKLGLANILGVLFHQEMVLAVPFSLVVLWLRPGVRARRWTAPLACALLVAAGIGIPYALAALLATGSGSPAGLLRWISHYRHLFAGSYGRIDGQTLPNTMRGVSAMFLGGSALKTYAAPGAPRDLRFLAAMLPFLGLAAALAVSLGAVLISFFRRGRPAGVQGDLSAGAAGQTPASAGEPLPAASPLVPRLLVAWLAVFAGFAIWWMPENRNFWAPVLPALVILCGIGLAGLGGRRKAPPAGWIAARAGRIVLAAWILLLVGGNLSGGILQKHFQRDADQELSTQLLRVVRPGDLVVVPVDRLWLCLTYYHPEVRCIGLDPREARQSAEPAAADSAWTTAARTAARTLFGGGRVFLASSLLPHFPSALEGMMPPAWTSRTGPAFSYVDSETPQDPREMLELLIGGAERAPR